MEVRMPFLTLPLPPPPPADPSDPDDCFSTGETCETNEENVVDIFYFDPDDDFSCEQRCEESNQCHYWSQFLIETYDAITNKCFLFRTCDNTEPCIECITGEVP